MLSACFFMVAMKIAVTYLQQSHNITRAPSRNDGNCFSRRLPTPRSRTSFTVISCWLGVTCPRAPSSPHTTRTLTPLILITDRECNEKIERRRERREQQKTTRVFTHTVGSHHSQQRSAHKEQARRSSLVSALHSIVCYGSLHHVVLVFVQIYYHWRYRQVYRRNNKA